MDNWDDPIDMMQVRLIGKQMSDGKYIPHLSGINVLHIVNEIIRQRAEMKRLRDQEEIRKHG